MTPSLTVSDDARHRAQQQRLAHATGANDQGDFTGSKIGVGVRDQLFVAGRDLDIPAARFLPLNSRSPAAKSR